ncbi:Ankyrin repeat family protein [Zea mays]|uniref:Ankyrin repeat family protein n=1 Tax=Zea mays TaxID=4577 RepID=A0A1D6LZE7_MAIZE|nr:Ankyrin repeat family protein [Zea mays]
MGAPILDPSLSVACRCRGTGAGEGIIIDIMTLESGLREDTHPMGAELRESKLMNKYNELKEAGKLDTFMERRRNSEDLDLSKEDLVKLLLEKDGSLKSKDKEFKDMKDKVLQQAWPCHNKRESENTKKYAIQRRRNSVDVPRRLLSCASVRRGEDGIFGRHLGTTTMGGAKWKEEEMVKTLRPSVWLTEDFPLSVDKFLSLLDILACHVCAVRWLRVLLTTKFPPGTFPVKVVCSLEQNISLMLNPSRLQSPNCIQICRILNPNKFLANHHACAGPPRHMAHPPLHLKAVTALNAHPGEALITVETEEMYNARSRNLLWHLVYS